MRIEEGDINAPYMAQNYASGKHKGEEEIMTKVFVLNADIIHFSGIDALVNSTNTLMPGKGGLDRLVWECGNYRKDIKGMKKCEARISNAHGLQYKYIIHAIVPQWNHKKTDVSIAELKQCYRNIFECCIKNEQRVKSVAIPPLGLKHRGIPDIEGTEIAIQIMKEYLDKGLKAVYFILSGYDVTRLYCDTMKQAEISFVEAKDCLIAGKDLLCNSMNMSEEDFGKVLDALSCSHDKEDIWIETDLEKKVKKGLKQVLENPDEYVATIKEWMDENGTTIEVFKSVIKNTLVR